MNCQPTSMARSETKELSWVKARAWPGLSAPYVSTKGLQLGARYVASRERELLTEITRLGLTITPLMRKLDDAVCV